MADPSDTNGDQTVEITDTPEIIHIEEDVLKEATEKLKAHVTKIELKIHRFPAKLRGFGRDMDYISPSIVAIGPYYHGVPELQAMELVKRMAVYNFCDGLADSPEEVYKKILPVACDVRGCYADVDALEGITDDDFAAMMFFDGCFLLECMPSLFSGQQSPFTSVIRSKGRDSILRDMALLENQIPWPVLEALMKVQREAAAVYGPGVMWPFFLYDLISGFRVSWSPGELSVPHSTSLHLLNLHGSWSPDFKPPHLLSLIHFHQVRSSYVKKESRSPVKAVPGPRKKEKKVDKLTVTTSAAELAEIGVKLTPNGTTQFSDMKVVRGPLFATLSLAPLLLDDLTACWLVNMAAFEQSTGGLGCSTPLIQKHRECYIGEVDYPVNSYLSVMAQLMNRDDDVHELHGKRIVHTIFDDNQTLKFFKRLAPSLIMDLSYLDILEGLEEYKQKRWVWIAIYKFLYNNAKTITTVLSIVAVLVGIFKTLFSLKQHQP